MKHLYLIVALALLPGLATAHRLTPDEALARVKSSEGPSRVAPTAQPTLAYTLEGALYVFNNADGYMVVSADDVAVPVLGYSDSGTFDPANIPPQMQWWFSQYAKEIAAASTEGRTVRMATSPVKERAAVAPLCKTRWDQGSPYNNDCPTLTSSSGTTGTAVTGCAATAMAQVMKVHNYPTTGVGSHSYSFTYLSKSYTQSFNFGNTTFDWANMIDDYSTTSSTSAQKSAVATLMHACGVAVDMSYGLSETGGSGASVIAPMTGLVTYFNYDKGMRYLMREFYSYADWVDAAYTEVAAGRPVLLTGQSNAGGHAFVCDGYSTDNYFHINWGWSGESDGYFLLSALDPDTQGIGGSGDGSGFDMDQSMLVGIQPAQSGSTVAPVMYFSGDFTPGADSYSKSQTMTFGTSNETMFVSYSAGTIDCTLGLKLTDASGDVQYVTSRNSSTSLATGSGWYTMSVSASSFPTGTYTVTPAFKSGSSWYDIPCAIGSVSYLTAVATSSKVTFTTPTVTSTFKVTSVSQETPIYIGQSAEFNVGVETTGEFYGAVYPALVSTDGSSIVAIGEPKGLTYTGAGTATLDWVTSFTANSSSTSFTAGTYYLCFISPEGVVYSSFYKVTVNAEQTVTPTVSVTSMAFNGVTGAGTSSNPYVVDPNDLSVTITIQGTQGYWADTVEGGIFNSSGSYVTMFGSKFVGVTSGTSKTFTLTGAASSITQGTSYLFTPWSDTYGQIAGVVYIRASTSGIEGVGTDAVEETPVYYNLQGVRIDRPQPGQVYIRVTPSGTQKVAF